MPWFDYNNGKDDDEVILITDKNQAQSFFARQKQKYKHLE